MYMFEAETIILDGRHKNLSEREMRDIAYRDFKHITDKDFKVLYTKKILDKHSDMSEQGKWEMALILVDNDYYKFPPCFTDVAYVPTVEELKDYTEEEIDYLIENAHEDEIAGFGEDNYDVYKDRLSRIREVVEEYRKNENKANRKRPR